MQGLYNYIFFHGWKPIPWQQSVLCDHLDPRLPQVIVTMLLHYICWGNDQFRRVMKSSILVSCDNSFPFSVWTRYPCSHTDRGIGQSWQQFHCSLFVKCLSRFSLMHFSRPSGWRCQPTVLRVNPVWLRRTLNTSHSFHCGCLSVINTISHMHTLPYMHFSPFNGNKIDILLRKNLRLFEKILLPVPLYRKGQTQVKM